MKHLIPKRPPAQAARDEAGAGRCPICDCRFGDLKSLQQHIMHKGTKKHPSVIEEIWRLRFLLEEAERDMAILRGQRDAWREAAKARR